MSLGIIPAVCLILGGVLGALGVDLRISFALIAFAGFAMLL